MRYVVLGFCVLAASCAGAAPGAPTPVSSSIGKGDTQTQALGGTELPFEGSVRSQTHSAFEPPITLVITGTEQGTATHLGQFTATSEDRVNTTNNTATGVFRFTAANGDQLWTTTVGVESDFVPPNVSHVTLAAAIVGGTGRFVAATGSLTFRVTQIIDFATNSATGSGTITGQLSLNR